MHYRRNNAHNHSPLHLAHTHTQDRMVNAFAHILFYLSLDISLEALSTAATAIHATREADNREKGENCDERKRR